MLISFNKLTSSYYYIVAIEQFGIYVGLLRVEQHDINEFEFFKDKQLV